MLRTGWIAVLLAGAAADDCTLPEGTEGADDGNPHCWDRIRRCDGPNAHPDGGPGYSPPCGACEGLGGPPWGDKNEEITLPKCTPLPDPGPSDVEPVRPEWAMGNGGKFTISNDRFIMIGKKTDPFCFSFFPSNNSEGEQCYRRQTGSFQVDMSKAEKSVRYDLNIHIPWPSENNSLFGNISTTIFHHGPNMWVVNNMYDLVDQCVCIAPHSTSGVSGSHNMDPIYPVMYNWTNHLSWLARERVEVEYGVGEMDLDHWVYGPHHAWTAVGDNKIVRMWQPYNGFEVFEPGSWQDGVADPKAFEDMVPPPQCKKEGGAPFRVTCLDSGFPEPRNDSAAAEWVPTSTAGDLQRARTKVPRSSHTGASFADMAKTLNAHILGQYKNSKECSEWTAAELQRFQAIMLLLKDPQLDELYQATPDRRQLRGDVNEHGQRWEKLSALAEEVGGSFKEMHRDGHCHEAVMWFVHHISEDVKREIAERLAVPLLPYMTHECPNQQHELCDEYLKQVSCQDCHADASATLTVI